ncbi:hypothetical protein D3C87_1569480 [compost metagenome]
MASVRGIGVAVMINWCGHMRPPTPFCRNASLCCTPKRCCSSMITSARFLNCTSSWNNAWVPTTIGVPLAICSSAATRFLPLSLPASHATSMPSGSSQRLKVMKCCSARISVGAISAT